MDNTQGKSQNMVTVQRSKNKFRLEQQDGEVWEVNLHEKKKFNIFEHLGNILTDLIENGGRGIKDMYRENKTNFLKVKAISSKHNKGKCVGRDM